MLTSIHEPFNIKMHSAFLVASPLVVLDPFYREYDIELTDTLHGNWCAQSALNVDQDSEYSKYQSAWIYKTCELLVNMVETTVQYKQLYMSSEFRNSHSLTAEQFLDFIKSNELALKAYKIILEYLQTIDSKLYENKTTSDKLSLRLFHEAINYLKIEFNVDQEIKFSEGMVKFGIPSKWNGEDLQDFKTDKVPNLISIFQEKHAKNLQIISERFPRRVQYLRVKHESQPEFTELSSDQWEAVGYFENSSGQLAISHKSFLDSITDHELQIKTTKLGNDTQVIDGERVNVGLCGSDDLGISCMTPNREEYKQTYIIRNDAGNIVELLVHFDLVDEDEDE